MFNSHRQLTCVHHSRLEEHTTDWAPRLELSISCRRHSYRSLATPRRQWRLYFVEQRRRSQYSTKQVVALSALSRAHTLVTSFADDLMLQVSGGERMIKETIIQSVAPSHSNWASKCPLWLSPLSSCSSQMSLIPRPPLIFLHMSPVSFKSSGNLLQSPELGSCSPQHTHVTLSQNSHMKWKMSVYTSACLTRRWGHQGQNWILFTLASDYPAWCQHIVGIQ